MTAPERIDYLRATETHGPDEVEQLEADAELWEQKAHENRVRAAKLRASLRAIARFG